MLETQFSSYSPLLILDSTLPSYISKLGWTEWLQSTQLPPKSLKWLVALPIDQKADIRKEALEKVEHGLWETSELLKNYLKAADDKMESLASGVRDAVRGR